MKYKNGDNYKGNFQHDKMNGNGNESLIYRNL